MRKNFRLVVSLVVLLIVGIVILESCKTDDTVTPASASVTALTCGSAVFSTAAAISGTAYTGTALVPYTGGNGASYEAGSAIASSGVTGLTATLQAGALASGSGNLTYAISGTPSAAGTATFAISFGGQNCNLALTVNAAGGPGGGQQPGGGMGGNAGVSEASSLTVTAIMSSTAGANTSCASSSGQARVVCLAQAFEATLSSTQLASVQLTYSLTNAQKWSNLPAGLSARYGINLASLTTTQLMAFRDLMLAVLALNATNQGYDEMVGNLVADNYLYTAGGGTTYGAGNYYVSIMGTPSTTGVWEILFTGHHFTQPYTFNGSAGSGYTPAFRAIEPTAAVTYSGNNRTYQSMEQERAAFAAMLTGLSSSKQTTAKLSQTFSDLVLGPGQDWKFPTTKVGLRVGSLDATRQALVLNAIRLYVNDLDATTAATVLAKYASELADTYIAYSGGTTVTAQNDYIRIDGPSVWIEFSSQGGVIIRNTPHPHSVWRDHITDYGGTK